MEVTEVDLVWFIREDSKVVPTRVAIKTVTKEVQI